MRLLATRVSQPERRPERLSDLQDSSMSTARTTKLRFTLWTAPVLLATIGALWALPQRALAAPTQPTGLTATALNHDTVSPACDSSPTRQSVYKYIYTRFNFKF